MNLQKKLDIDTERKIIERESIKDKLLVAASWKEGILHIPHHVFDNGVVLLREDWKILQLIS